MYNLYWAKNMATTVKELIEYLKTIPLDTELQVVETYDCGYSMCARYVPLDIDELKGNVTYTNLSDNQFVKEDSPNFDKRFLDFGDT